MSWREQIRAGYPWRPLVFVAVMLVFVLATIISMLVVLPAERAVIDHGATTTGHAIAYKSSTGRNRSSYSFEANVTWRDAAGNAHEQKELGISERAYREIGDGSDVEIKYIGDRAVIAMDVEFRVRDESNAPVLLAILGIALLLGLYHWRRRLREWRAPKPVQW